MKKFIGSLTLLAVLFFCFVNISFAEKEVETYSSVLENLAAEYDRVLANIKQEFETIEGRSEITYAEYLTDKQIFADWYELVFMEFDKLYVRTVKDSKKYYLLIAETIDHEDSDNLESAIEDFYDVIYDKKLEDFYDEIYDEAYDDIYDDYYDEIFENRPDDVDSNEFWSERSKFYDLWSDSKSGIYRYWSDAKTKIYRDYEDIRTAFLYRDNFNVEAILKNRRSVIE